MCGRKLRRSSDPAADATDVQPPLASHFQRHTNRLRPAGGAVKNKERWLQGLKVFLESSLNPSRSGEDEDQAFANVLPNGREGKRKGKERVAAERRNYKHAWNLRGRVCF